MIKRIAQTVSKSKNLMALSFVSEVMFFFLSGHAFHSRFFLASFVLMCFGLFYAFTLGEAIRIKARREESG